MLNGQLLVVNRLATGLVLALLLAGCQQKMAVQPSLRPLRPSEFFEDERSARPLVVGTVARGQLHDDPLLYTGKSGKLDSGPQAASAVAGLAGVGAVAGPSPWNMVSLAMASEPYAHAFPFPVTTEIMYRGRQRFGIFCAICHDATGSGHGMVVRRGFPQPPSFHIPRLRQAPVGYVFNVITNGYGAMPDHAAQIPVRDRWAIVAYVRALQLSRNATLKDVPPDVRQKLEGDAK
jgi:mono/diheme cytochrome c family protein